MEFLLFFAKAGDKCDVHGGNILGMPHWYAYLGGVADGNGHCVPTLSGLSDIWLIAAAVIEILLRVAALAAVGFVVYGGIQYVVSQGEPEKTGKARSTITSALIGLILAIMAAVIIQFIAGSINNAP